ncbi:right-handed parallel beta-helix repeat-containing protein [Agarivorans sp. Z349TD_8]|uniref:right-handed parallel beta-helix repeat-containing protein n=1 Tax=Agarivorans sp. Z349TD_8 TaxID=3421434 RepID=UPI003D7CB93C
MLRTVFISLLLFGCGSSSIAVLAANCGSGGGASVCLAASPSAGAIALNWTIEGTVSNLQLYRDTDADPSGRTRIATLNTTTTSYSDNTIQLASPYYYWLKFTANGQQYNSAVASATTYNTVCGEYLCLNASANNATIDLNWSKAGEVSSIQLYRDTDADPSGRVRIASLSNSAQTYVDQDTSAGTTYYYWIKYGLAGSQYNSNTAQATASGAASCAGETSGVIANHIYYVSPTGTSWANGDSFNSALDFNSALNLVGAGEMILLQAGSYNIPYTSGVANTITLAKSGQAGAPISVVAANCGRAIIDFSFPEQQWVQNSYGFALNGDYWYFKGIEVTRAGYQGVYVKGKHNTFENCAFHHNRNTGLEINKGGAYTTVINSDAYRNYDPKKDGSMADGFGPKQTQGPGNKFIGCRAWENSDDGFDTYDSDEVVIIENSWAFRNGVDVWGYGGFSGNGNGFKLGGNFKAANNRISNSVAFGNPLKGFDQNNNAGGITLLNNTAYDNGINFGFGNSLNDGETHIFRNNISLSSSENISNADQLANSWNGGVSLSAADFLSLDLSLATMERNIDGSLADNDLFKLKSDSDLIDAGVDVGLPSLGLAPDLGAFEKQ